MATTLEVRTLTPALQQKAIDELNEVPERVAEDIATLRDWVLKQPHLRSRLTDQFMIAFLRGCKYSLEKAKKKLDRYYTYRTNVPDLLTSFVDDQRVRAMIQLGVGLYLPLPLQEDGPRLILIRTGHYSVDEYSLFELMKMNVWAQDLNLVNDDNAVVSGFVQLLDFSEFTPAHFFQLNPSRVMRINHYIQEALPLRMRASHFFNTGSGFETMYATIKPLLPQKFQTKMHIHKSVDSLYEQIPQKFLPKEYGGENGSIDEIIASNVEKFMQYREYLLEEKNYGTDEKLRVGEPINFENIFGAEGSFRKLNVD